MNTQRTFPDSAQIDQMRRQSILFETLQKELGRVVIGNDEQIKLVITALLCNGHVLLEGVPGVAKTTLIKSIAQALGVEFKRIQFTPDLLPSDVIGTLIYNQRTQEFETKRGPIFTHLLLADEINRAPAKVQSALLEAMQERQVTIGNESYALESPFLVCATQNPLEQEGTYPLPEAQLDRFLCKILVGYPSALHEKMIVTSTTTTATLPTLITHADLLEAQELVKQVYMDDALINYCIALVHATRFPNSHNVSSIAPYLEYGVSPRATIGLCQASKAYAFLSGRHFVTPDDVKLVAPAILRHRLTLSYSARAERITADTIIRTIVSHIPTP